MREKVSISDLLLEKYGDWDAICEVTSLPYGIVRGIDLEPLRVTLESVRFIAHALGMSTAEMVQLIVDD